MYLQSKYLKWDNFKSVSRIIKRPHFIYISTINNAAILNHFIIQPNHV